MRPGRGGHLVCPWVSLKGRSARTYPTARAWSAPAAPYLAPVPDHTGPENVEVLAFREGGPAGLAPGEGVDRPTNGLTIMEVGGGHHGAIQPKHPLSHPRAQHLALVSCHDPDPTYRPRPGATATAVQKLWTLPLGPHPTTPAPPSTSPSSRPPGQTRRLGLLPPLVNMIGPEIF